VLAFLGLGCTRIWEEDAYKEARRGSRMSDKQHDVYLRSLEAELGPKPKDLQVGTGRQAGPGMLLTFRVESLDDRDGTVAQSETLKVLYPALRLEGTRVTAGVAIPAPQRVIVEFGRTSLPLEWLADMKVGGVRVLPRFGPVTLLSVNEKEDRRIEQLREIKGTVRFTRNPDIRVTLVDACEADLKRVSYRHLNYSGNGFISVPNGIKTDHWYVLRGCE
jgi:hypothetical protein